MLDSVASFFRLSMLSLTLAGSMLGNLPPTSSSSFGRVGVIFHLFEVQELDGIDRVPATLRSASTESTKLLLHATHHATHAHAHLASHAHHAAAAHTHAGAAAAFAGATAAESAARP